MNNPTELINVASNSLGEAATTPSDAIGDLVTGIPAPIRKSAYKSIGRLITAAVDIPIAHMEGKAAEIRAINQARRKIIDVSNDQIMVQMNIQPDFARLASEKYAQKIIRERLNIDKITKDAITQLQQLPEPEVKPDAPVEKDTVIDDTWLNHFETEAAQKSSEEMQLLFSRILAGEIQRPSSFSIKTLKLLSSLDSNTAKLFQLLCSLCLVGKDGDNIVDARVCSLGGNAGNNSLIKYGLGFAQLNILHENGLIIADYNSYMPYSAFNAFTYQNNPWILVPTDMSQIKDFGNLHGINKFNLHGVALSQSGRELFSIVDIKPVAGYSAELEQFFNNNKLNMTPVVVPK